MRVQRKHLFSALLAGILACTAAQASEQAFRTRVSAYAERSVDAITQDVKAEIQFGRDVAARILGRHPIAENDKLNHYVRLVGHTVARNSTRPELKFHFALLDTDEINAYAAPGGYIFVTRGAMNLIEDESELAAVLAHEVGHVSERHIVKELDIKGKDASMGAGLAQMIGGAGETARIAFTQAVDKAVELLFETGLKKEDEFDADLVGTVLSTNTGYDPQALRRYLDRVREVKGDKTKILSHTHPPFVDRVRALDEFLLAENLNLASPKKLAARFKEYTQE